MAYERSDQDLHEGHDHDHEQVIVEKGIDQANDHGKVSYFTDNGFQSEVLDNGQVTVVDLWAEWCGPCRMMNPIIEELASEYNGRAVIGKLNVDDNPNVAINYNVRGIPTFLIFKGGELKDKVVGAQTKKALQDKIDALLA